MLRYGSESGVSVLICPTEPSRERVKVSHVINECRVIYHDHPEILTRRLYYIFGNMPRKM